MRKRPSARPFINADLARLVGDLSFITARHSRSLAQGVWNPNFCNADAGPYAAALIAEIKPTIALIERRLRQSQKSSDPSPAVGPLERGGVDG